MIAEVIIDRAAKKLNRTFDYNIPKELEDLVVIGSTVLVPFGKTKVQQLIKSGKLPLMKIGKDYITTFNILEKWIGEHLGEEIYY